MLSKIYQLKEKKEIVQLHIINMFLVIQICLLFPMLIWVCDEISYFVDQRNELVFRFLLRFELSCYAVGNDFFILVCFTKKCDTLLLVLMVSLSVHKIYVVLFHFFSI